MMRTSRNSDLLKPVTVIMSVTVLSRVVTGFVCTVRIRIRIRIHSQINIPEGIDDKH